jgi:hypothetical protein
MRIRILTLALAAAGLALAGGARGATGDISGDGFIGRPDVALALRYAGGLSASDFAHTSAADVDGDGRVSIVDAVRIARIANGRDPLPPAYSLPAQQTLTISANAPRNIALPGGYSVSGRVRDKNNAAFEGSVLFQDASKALWGPAPLNGLGDYATALPPGTYQAIALSRRSAYAGSGELTTWDTATALGAPFTVSADTTGKNFSRPDTPATVNVKFDFSGPSRPTQVETQIVLTDTGANAATFGLNDVRTAVLSLPATRPVPPGAYYVDAQTSLFLSSGFSEDFYLAYDQTLTVPAATARTLAFPAVYELAGTFGGANGANALDFYAQQNRAAGVNAASARVPQRQQAYRVAIPAGGYVASIAASTPYADTTAEFLLPFTMPAQKATQNISLPAYPTFRTVSGLVVGADGLAMEGARVRIDSVDATVPAAGRYAFHADTLTDDDGAYAVALPNGDYTLTVTPSS